MDLHFKDLSSNTYIYRSKGRTTQDGQVRGWEIVTSLNGQRVGEVIMKLINFEKNQKEKYPGPNQDFARG